MNARLSCDNPNPNNKHNHYFTAHYDYQQQHHNQQQQLRPRRVVGLGSERAMVIVVHVHYVQAWTEWTNE